MAFYPLMHLKKLFRELIHSAIIKKSNNLIVRSGAWVTGNQAVLREDSLNMTTGKEIFKDYVKRKYMEDSSRLLISVGKQVEKK